MSYWIRFFVCILLGCTLAVSCIDDDDPQGGTIQLGAGDNLPAFAVRMSDGQTITNESLEGKTSVIVFFNTGCKDCQHELPILQRVYEAYPQINMVCISREEGEADIQSYWSEHHFTLPYSAQEDRAVYYLFAKSGIPQVFIVNKDLRIDYLFSDYPLATYEELVAAIESSL